MRVHFISVGGSIMHNLAIAFHKKGYIVTGSDDEIFEPAKSRLARHGLLPANHGWSADKIDRMTDAVILGMHARADNPELLKAQELGIKIFSFPEFIYENSRNKKRVVIAGSHGKTTITSMIMHVLAKNNYDFDYLVGSQVPGFEDSVRISENAPTIIIEGDEYLSSALDRKPKFLWYKPHVALISGVAWDHMNVFPTYEIYKKQFSDFLDTLPLDSRLFWCRSDTDLEKLIRSKPSLNQQYYYLPDYRLVNGKFMVRTASGKEYLMNIYGSHNLMNLEGARMICSELGVDEDQFYSSVQDFQGAGKRLEIIYHQGNTIIFRDFAHAPSKVKATIDGIKEQYPAKKIIGCLELHTFSSLNSDFLPQYSGTADQADHMLVFINEEAAKIKNMPLPERKEILKAFNKPGLKIFYERKLLMKELEDIGLDNAILLLMSSGNFDNMNMNSFIEKFRV